MTATERRPAPLRTHDQRKRSLTPRWAAAVCLLAAGLGGTTVAATAGLPTQQASGDRRTSQEGAKEDSVAGRELAENLGRLITSLRGDAAARGVSRGTFEAAMRHLEPDATIPDLLRRQPEHVLTPWDYMARLVSPTRIADGQRLLIEHRSTLDAIEARLAVDRHVVVAIWGIESNYGTLPGTRYVIRSLATLAVADTRRPDFWRRELLTALQILQRGDIAVEAMTGSWAGAMGHTQFMPSSYMAHGFDLDGDGRRDIWRSIPDALASTASYLGRSGWRAGEPWATEVFLPAGFDYAVANPDVSRSPEEWRRAGVTLPAGQDWPSGMAATSLLLPAGMHGPAFLVGGNFQAIQRYNNATAYALAVSHLADRIAGRPPLRALWPEDDPPVGPNERLELQRLLTALGHSVGGIDGIIGEGTRSAVRAWQRQQGLPADGWTGARLMGLLRTAAGKID